MTGFYSTRRTPAYRTAAVQRGNIESTVAATGTLGAVTTVHVGTQVSGQISAIYVDVNSKVKKGQLIARIDPTLQQQSVEDAQVGVSRAQATMTQTRLEYDRNKLLHDQKIVTDPEFNTAQLNYQLAKANATSAQIALDKARQNLSYTSIYAPIDGIVVARYMDVGQTAAASLSAPPLFVIAKDLSQMQILATVDESDIGQIKDEQTVSFTVQAYPGPTFTGAVRQVCINSTTVNNVVNYTAVVAVGNPDGKLVPGMTATVKFLIGSARDALSVPNAALRFKPAIAAGARASKGDSTRTSTQIRNASATTGGLAATAVRDATMATLWVKAANAGWWPTVSLSAGYNSAYSSATNLAFLDQFGQQRGGSIAIGVSIPIFDRGQTSVDAQKAKIQEDNAKVALDAQKQQVAL